MSMRACTLVVKILVFALALLDLHERLVLRDAYMNCFTFSTEKKNYADLNLVTNLVTWKRRWSSLWCLLHRAVGDPRVNIRYRITYRNQVYSVHGKSIQVLREILQFFGCVNLLDICFHIYMGKLSYHLSGNNLQTNFDYTRFKN
jgi:hypothetical protein